MNRWIGIGLIMAGLWVGGCGTEHGGAVGGIGRPATVPTTQAMSCDQLIDRFVTISTADYGVQTNILDTPGNPTETQEGLLPLGPREVKPSEAMEELVRRGFDSIGPLVRHIDDARPTQFKIVNENMAFLSMTADNEYDYNPRTTAEPPGVNVGKHHRRDERPEQLDSHVLTVGDVCFKVLGQIVGREYDPIRYQPTACLVINSPTHAPALAKAVRDEWGTLTREQHKQKLVQDLLQPGSLGGEQSAIEALARYYPEAVEEPVIRRLQLPVYDRGALQDLCLKIEKLDAQQKREACERFIEERGPMYRDALLKFIVESDVGPWNRIITDAYPEIDLKKGYYADLNSRGHLEALIDCLTYTQLHTPRLDACVYGLYQQAVKGPEPMRNDGLATSCIDYLAGRGHDAEFLAYCQDYLESTIYKEHMHKAIEKLTETRRSR